MGHITQRQTTLVLVSLMVISLVLIVVNNWLQPDRNLAVQQGRFIFYLFLTGVLWLLVWVDWIYARHLTLVLMTVLTAVAIPEATLSQSVSQGALLPPILASAIVGVPGILGSAIVTWLILLWRSGGEGMYAMPAGITIYALAISGLVLGRTVVDAKLAHERDLLQSLMDNIPDMIYFKDTRSRFNRINKAQANVLGANNPEDALGKTDFDFQSAALAEAFFAEEQQMMASGQLVLDRIEYNPTPDGRPRWFSASKAPIRDKNGRVVGMVGITRDVTERELMQRALEESARNYREIFNATSDAIFIHDIQTGAILDVNSRALEMYGYTFDEILQAKIDDLSVGTPPYTQAEALITLENAVAKGPQLFEWLSRRKNGELFWTEISLRGSEIGGHGRVLAAVRDITERKQNEEAVRLSEELFTKAFRSTSDGISISTLEDGRLIDINNGHTRIFGYSREEVIGQTALSLNLYANPADREHMRSLLQENGELHNLELTAQRKSGELFDALFSAEIIYVQGEECIVGTVRDITPQKQAAAALQAYAKELERSNQELDNFAHVASHDLQEPLRKIQSFSQRLLERYEGELDERGQDYLQRMDSAAARMQMLIHDLLAYARVSTHSNVFSPVSLTHIVQNVLVDLEVRLEATGGQVIVGDLPIIEADPTQMRQLLQNLISNGLKFHKPGVPPIIQVTAELVTDSDQSTTLKLAVADNGIGFDEAYLPRLFTIFQRLHTRDAYEGTGIGLAICRRIAEQHGGTISGRSQPGEGASFIVTLPMK